MGKTQAIQIRKGLTLYKQVLGSPNWYARAYVRVGGRAVHIKSTGTTDVKAATDFAEDYWQDRRIEQRLERAGGPLLGLTQRRADMGFDRVADAWLDQTKAEAGKNKSKLRACKDNWHACFGKGGFAVFFGKDDIRLIGTDRIREYLLFQEQASSKAELASSTKRRTLAILRSFFTYAREKGLISAIPIMPRVKLRDQPRPWFEPSEYRKLYRTAWKLARQARDRGDIMSFGEWMEIADFVIFMVSTFLRPSEWADIRLKHIEEIAGRPTYLKIAVVEGKTGKRTLLSMPGAVRVHRRLAARRGHNSNAFLFMPEYTNRQTAREKMADLFGRLMKFAGLTYDTSGNRRSSYSLRHSSLMFRIIDGADSFVVAKNAGTSVDQLHRFYLSHFTAAMNLSGLHGRPRINRTS